MIPIFRPNISFLREALAGPLAARASGMDMQIGLVHDGDGAAAGAEADAFWRECAMSEIEVHRFVDRLGLAGNWNRCLQSSRGHLVHILHQDDRVLPQFYDAVAAAFDTEPRIGACFTQHRFIAADGTLLRQGHLDSLRPGLLTDWLEYVVANLAIQCPAIVVKRLVYERLGGFDGAFRYCVDRDMWQRIATNYPLWHDPAPLADYRIHERSATASLSSRLTPWLEAKQCVKKALCEVSPPARRQTALSAKRHLVRLAMVEARSAFYRGDWQRAGAAVLGGLLTANVGDFAAVARGRYDVAPMGRLPVVRPDLDGGRKFRVLLLTEFVSYDSPRDVCDPFQRLRHHIEGLSALGPVDVIFFVADASDAARVAALSLQWAIDGLVRSVVTGRRRNLLDRAGDGAVDFFNGGATSRTSRREQAAELRRLLEGLQPDLVFAYRTGPAAALVRANTPLPPVVVDLDEIEHLKLERLAAASRATGVRARGVQRLLARRAELQIGKMASCLLVCSNLDRERLRAVCPSATIATLPNTASAFCDAPIADTLTAVFVGAAEYGPNRDAILWLATEIWPLVCTQLPGARLRIVGEGTERLRVVSDRLRIEVHGFVADMAAVYAQARLALSPIRLGGGTGVKILEAAMCSRPVVSTAMGAEGLALEPNSEILIADDAAAFAAACVRLLSDAKLAERVGTAARRRAEKAYSAARIADRLATLCTELINAAHTEGGSALTFALPDGLTSNEIGMTSRPSFAVLPNA